MTQIGTEAHPLRVAIIGAGPTGFYTADYLTKQKELTVEVDIFDRLPTPFGLVRGGVAPDHQKIKSVTKAYHRTAMRPGVRFFGYVEVGKDVTIPELQSYYHQVVLTVGAQSDRKMGIPGEDLINSHPATEFVAWYNGHPDYRHLKFDLSQERVAIVGVGNVAVDVSRILSRTSEELATTDIASYALEALSQSNIKEVYMLGRRGPAQAAFTNPEIRELGELDGADAVTLPEEVELDPLSAADLEAKPDRLTEQKVAILQDYASRDRTDKPRTLTVRFLVSPVELIDDGQGRVKAMKIVKNELYRAENGTLRPKPTDEYEELPVGLVFRSVGYRGERMDHIPFNDRWGVIHNDKGRILSLETDSNEPLPGLYTAGWIKRGPSGVIGTNKPDAVETAICMLEDLEAGNIPAPAEPTAAAAQAFIAERQPHYVSYEDWLKLDELEVAKGKALGPPRVKFTSIPEMMTALGR